HTMNILTTYETTGTYAGPENVRYTFSTWSDGSLDNPRVVNLNSSESFSAILNESYKVLTTSNVYGVSISVSSNASNDFYSKDSTLTLNAPSIPGYLLKAWLINGSPVTVNPYIEKINSPVEATAEYVGIVPPSIPTLSSPEDNSEINATSLILAWNDSDPNNLSLKYDLYFGMQNDIKLVATNLSVPEYNMHNLDWSTTYNWYIVADNGYKNTEGPVWTFTTSNPPVPSAPSNFHTTNVAYNSVTLSWNSVSGASGYYIYRSMDGSNFTKISTITGTSYTDSGLSANTAYYYRLSSYNQYGQSSYSSINVTTPSSPAQVNATITGNVSVYTGQSAFISSAAVPIMSQPPLATSNSGPSYVPGEIIVGFKNGISSKALGSPDTINAIPFKYKVSKTLQTPDNTLNVSLLDVSTSVEKAISYFKSIPGVLYAEPNYISHALSVTPNDPDYSDQWALPDIQAPQAWQVSKGSNTVIVAVIDTGVSSTHPDLQGILVPGYNFVSNNTDTMDDFGHGTHVAGIIDADTNNGIGIAGVNWGGVSSTKIMPVKVLDSTGSGNDFDISEGIVYATQHGAKVINMSFGGISNSQTEQEACQYAYNNGVTLVAAAGNNALNTLLYPAAYSTVIPVAAVGSNNQIAYYSNYYSNVVCSPGSDILSTYYATSTESNTYAYLYGTSMAAPQVSGLAALMISNGITGPANIRNIIQNTATNIGPSSTYGYGLINAYKALTYNGGWEPMVVFAQNSSGVTVKTVDVSNDGSFSMNLPAGTYKIYAWQDFNGDSQIDTGDFYGFYGYSGNSTDMPLSLNLISGQSINLNLLVSTQINNENNPVGNVGVVSNYVHSLIESHYKK
ncbi:MAG: S8 family serine peptidase, partial [Athalassotoga sp.]